MFSLFSAMFAHLCVDFLVLVSMLAWIAYLYSTWTFDHWKRSNVPYARPVPLFGNYLNIALCIDNPQDTYRRIYREFAGHRYCGMWQMRTPYLMLRDPELINAVLIKDFAYFPSRGIHVEFDKEPLTEHVGFVENPRWKRIRAKLTPAFTSGKLKGMLDQMNECGEEMIKNLYDLLRNESGSGVTIDARDLIADYAMDVIGTCAFGLKLNSTKDAESQFRVYGKALFQASPWYLLRELVLMVSPALLSSLRLTRFPEEASRYFHTIFNETIRYREQNNMTRNDLVDILMKVRKDLVLDPNVPPEERLTETQIVANAFVMFSNGFETISTATSFCLHELALKKHIQDRVRDEIKTTKSKFNGAVDSNFLLELNYLDMVISETLRKYPATFGLFRKAADTYHVPNDSLIIEKGQKILIPIMCLHNDPKYYSDPEVFDPQRFSPEEKAKRPSGVYLPFGDGPRICIAKRFAEMEMKLVLVKLLSEFEVEPCEKTEIPVIFTNMSVLAGTKSGKIWLKFKRLSGDKID